MDKVIPLQHTCWCKDCNQPRCHAEILVPDNRKHLLCLQCGATHVKLFGDEDDRGTSIGPYPRYDNAKQASDLSVCELIPKPSVNRQDSIQYKPMSISQHNNNQPSNKYSDNGI